ncbi:MAG: DUF2169 domain-containing protein [Candidatus Latescibacteria bacterium]|nr:DUF2169 domain-containing protein [Candidatus Latescibacterota bacterium]
MEYVNRTSFAYAHIAGRLNFPGHSLTLIVKGTFELHHGGIVTPSKEQIFPTGDEFYPEDDGEMTGSCRYEYDFAYFKPRTDLLLAGHCHAPGSNPVPGCPATFKVGSHSKTLYVFGDRTWKGPPGMRVISDPKPFSQMELKYENSYGGSGYPKNPVGKGFQKQNTETETGVLFLPNIEDPDNMVDSPGSQPEPAGFGPLGRMWQQRHSKMGTYTGRWIKERWPWFPLDFDWGHFNAAPPDMQVVGYLRGDEQLYFENLHPEHAHYESKLPGLRIRCFLNKLIPADTSQTNFVEVSMKLDTLWVDMDADKLVLVWRGSAEVLSDEYEEVQHIFIMSEPLGQQPAALAHCSELFLATLAEEEAEEAIEPEEPEPVIPEEETPEIPEIMVPGAAAAGVSIPGLAAAEIMAPDKEKPEEILVVPEEVILPAEPEAFDPEKLKVQAKKLLAQAGLDFDSFSPEAREKADKEMDNIISKMTETDPIKILEQQRNELEIRMNEAFAKSGIDTANLPPVSEKAHQEQVRMLRELGIENTDSVFQDPEMSRIWNILFAVLPGVGISPEDISPLIQEVKRQQDRINNNISGFRQTDNADT